MLQLGRVEVITGCMYSGKSEELVRRLRRALLARKTVMAFKHTSDDRYEKDRLASHGGQTFKARAYKTVKGMGEAARGAEVIAIDEAQFFGPELVTFCEAMADIGCRVIIAGLDLDSDGKPFGPIPVLMAVAEQVDKLTAICMVCGGVATRSYHKTGKDKQVEVGAEQYEARCRGCAQYPTE